MLTIAPYHDEDRLALETFAAAIQDFERSFTPALRPGEEIASAYIDYLLKRAGEVSGLILVAAEDERPAVVLLVDTFTRWFDPANAGAAAAVLAAAGYRVQDADPPGERPLCCGRTYLAAGMLPEARREAGRLIAAIRPFVEPGLPVVGLEPSCLLTLRDEYEALLPGPATAALAGQAVLLEELLTQAEPAGRLAPALRPLPGARALVHGHCHQKAHGTLPALEACLRLVPELAVEVIETSCCGMAGAFGYEAEHHAISLAMAELDLLPAIRAADSAALLVANGTSCRQQIQDGSGRTARHLALVLAQALGQESTKD